MTATGPFATAGTDSKPDRRSLLGHGPATLVRGRLLLASLAATPRLREDAVRYYLATTSHTGSNTYQTAHPGPRSTTAPEHRTPTSTRHGPSNTAAGCHHPAGSAPSGIAEFYCSSPEPSGRRAQQFQPLTLFGAQVDSELPAVKFLVHAREDRWLRVRCRCPIPATSTSSPAPEPPPPSSWSIGTRPDWPSPVSSSPPAASGSGGDRRDERAIGDVYLRCPDGTTRPGQDSTGTNRSRPASQGNCPGDVAAHRLDHRVLAVDACSCGWIWRRSSTRGSHRALRRPLHALPATGIAPQLPPSAPSEAEVCTGRVGGKSASGVEDRHAHPSVLHQICTPLWKPRSDSERTPETVSARSSTRRRTRNPVRRGVHSRRLPPPHHGRTGRQTRCGGTL